MGDGVGDAAVDLVPEPGEHRHGTHGDRERDRLGVERRQLVARSATSDDDDTVEIGTAAQCPDRRRDGQLGAGALHPRVEHRQMEPEAAADDLVVQVVPGGGADAGDDPDPHRDPRERTGPVGVVQTGSHQTPDHLIAGLGELAQREPRVDAGHLEPEPAVGRVVVEMTEDADLHAVGQLEPIALEQWGEVALHRSEQRDLEHGASAVGLFDQREVGVWAAVTEPVDLAAHPHPVAEPAAKLVVDGICQLSDGVRRVRRVVGGLVAEVERRLAHDRRFWPVPGPTTNGGAGTVALGTKGGSGSSPTRAAWERWRTRSDRCAGWRS